MERLILLSFFLLVLPGLTASGQSIDPPQPVNVDSLVKAQANDSILAQQVDSRKGYVARVPSRARLDSTRSGWNPEQMYERRVYVIEGAGEIVFTVTVGEIPVPEGATQTGAYTYLERDSLTAAGTAWKRTYYLPTRSVRIEILPYGIGMHKIITERERLFSSFRWKIGAESETPDVDQPRIPIPTDIKVSSGLGG